MVHTLKVKVDYGKVVYVTPFNSFQEKQILLMLSLDEESTLDDCLEILKDNIDTDYKNLTDNEKVILLYKLRGISTGESIPVQFKCKNKDCKAPNSQEIIVTDLFTKGTIENDKFDTLTDDNFQDYVDLDIDELDLDEYDKLFEEIQNKKTKFNFIKQNKCHKCGTLHNFDISTPKFLIDNMSEDSLMSIYQSINNLVFFSHYNKEDVDNMLPFERTVLFGLLEKTKETLATN